MNEPTFETRFTLTDLGRAAVHDTSNNCPTCGSETPAFCECDPEPVPKPEPIPSFGPDKWDADEVKNFFDKRFEN